MQGLSNKRPSSFKVVRPELCDDILEQIALVFNIHRKLTHNPAPNPVSLTRNELSQILHNEYVVAEKDDGVRYLVLLGRYSRSKSPFAVMVDRNLSIYQVQLYAPLYMFKTSLFDGELVLNRENNSLSFRVFDVMHLGGRSVMTMDFTDRYALVNEHFLSRDDWDLQHVRETKAATQAAVQLAENDKVVVVPNTTHPLFFHTKPFISTSNFGSLVRRRHALTHDSDGYIFMPVKEGVKRNRHRTMFKWKDEPTIDVLAETEEGSAVKFFLQEDEEKRRDATELGLVFPNVGEHRGVLEMSVAKDKTCTLHRVRDDKSDPNNWYTAQSILREIDDGITLEELIEAFTKRDT